MKASDVIVTNTKTKIKVEFKNLVVGYEYNIYEPIVDYGTGWSGYLIKQFTAKKTSQTIDINMNEQAGYIFITAYDKKSSLSEITRINYATATIPASNVKINNNFNTTKDVIIKDINQVRQQK